jgi:ribosome-associated protein
MAAKDGPVRPDASNEGGEYIKLDQFLKVQRRVQTGGEAKVRIQAGEVRVNGEVETRRGRKLRQGDVVWFEGESLMVEFE